MQVIIELWPFLIAMVVLMGISAFFSASEAALFSLRARERRELKESNRASQRAAFVLLRRPERLLSAVLFWNLLVNIIYFALVSLASFRLQNNPDASKALSVGLPIGALLLIIFMSEMLPKSVAVMRAKSLSGIVGPPLAVAVAALDPVMPYLQKITLVSQRLVWPSFRSEAYLEIADFERAIEITKTSQELIEQEQRILRSIVSLSDLGVEECMRPRTQLVTYRPPVKLSDLIEKPPRSGYLLVTEPDNDEISSAINLTKVTDINRDRLEHLAEPVIFVPWCVTTADALQRMHTKERETAVVVNELGETIGVITRQDILDVLFSSRPSRSERLLNRDPIRRIEASELDSDGDSDAGSERIAIEKWEVTGITNLRYLEEYFSLSLPTSRNVTVGGVIQETLQRLPEVGDRCTWGPFDFEVTEEIAEDQILVHMSRHSQEGDS